MEWVEINNVSELEQGDIVRKKFSGEIFMVTVNYGERATAVKTVDITNPVEWEIFKHESHKNESTSSM